MPDSEAAQFLDSLYEQAKQDGEDPEEVAQRVYQNARGIGRREVMQAGALGAGGLLGGVGTIAATERAAADPSTADSDGNVGTPSDPVDLFADGTEYQDASSDPSSNGQVQRNGTDVKVYSGGGVRNLSDVGGGGNVPNWQEDGNSPASASGTSSFTYTLASSYDQVMVLADPSNLGFDDLKVNGDTGSNYDYVENDDTQTNGANFWSIGGAYERASFTLIGDSGGIYLSVERATKSQFQTVYGANFNVSAPINQFTLSSGSNKSTTIHVYGWNA